MLCIDDKRVTKVNAPVFRAVKNHFEVISGAFSALKKGTMDRFEKRMRVNPGHVHTRGATQWLEFLVMINPIF